MSGPSGGENDDCRKGKSHKEAGGGKPQSFRPPARQRKGQRGADSKGENGGWPRDVLGHGCFLFLLLCVGAAGAALGAGWLVIIPAFLAGYQAGGQLRRAWRAMRAWR